MKLGILILHFNQVKFTNDLCATIPEAIVIDNGSDKEPYHGPNRCIRFETNLHFTKGWMEAVKAVWDEFDAFWLCNNDIVITRKDIDRIKWVMDNCPDVRVWTPAYNCWLEWCRPRKKDEMLKRVQHDVVGVPLIEFTAPVIRKEAFEKWGFWEEIFVRGWGCDWDWCYKIRESGESCYVDYGCSFRHLGQQTTDHLPGYYDAAIREFTEGTNQLHGKDWKATIMKDTPYDYNYNFNHDNHGNRIAVYTTIFGDYDYLKPVKAQRNGSRIDWYCVTDNPRLRCPAPWKLLVVEHPFPDMHPRMRAKYYKLKWYAHEVLADYYKVIFIDASIEVLHADFVHVSLGGLRDMKLYRHPMRSKIADEVLASEPLQKYKDLPLAEQVKSYFMDGYAEQNGLYGCGVMARTHNDRVKMVMERWWQENLKWTYQDQLSFPYVCWKEGFTPQLYEGVQNKNDYFKIKWHDDSPQRGKNEASLRVKHKLTEIDKANTDPEQMGFEDMVEFYQKYGVNINLKRLFSAALVRMKTDSMQRRGIADKLKYEVEKLLK